MSLEVSTYSVLRVGGTPIEEIEVILGNVDINIEVSSRPQAPGQLKRHYSTNTCLEIAEESAEKDAGEKVGLLSLTKPENPPK